MFGEYVFYVHLYHTIIHISKIITKWENQFKKVVTFVK
jgi:hypothetical protein